MSDTESSSSDNFEDAVESVELAQSPTSKAKRNTMKRGVTSADVAAAGATRSEHQLSPEIEDQIEILTGDQLAQRDCRWRRLENLRRRGETGAGDDQGSGQDSPLNVTCGTPADSRESSVEGIYLSGVRSNHPFKVVECDSRSVQSDNKSGRNEGSHRSSVSDVRPPPIPDIVSSSKPASVPKTTSVPVSGVGARSGSVTTLVSPTTTLMGPPPSLPLAPPRKKRSSTSSITPESAEVSFLTGTKPKPGSLAVESINVNHPIPSPASTVASLTKDLEKHVLRSPSPKEENLSVHNLNIRSALKGEYVVRPQDEECRRGEQPRKLSCSDSTGINQDPAGVILEEEGLSGTGRGSIGKSRRKDGYTSGGSGSFHSGGSGGYHSSKSQVASGRGSGESRKSMSGSDADNSGMMKQMNLFVRTKTDSGSRMSDQEILKQIKVKNLDDGTELDLATAEDRMPKYTDPLSQHIMRLTSEYATTQSVSDIRSIDSDTESLDSRMSDFYEIGRAAKKKQSFTKFVGNFGKNAKTAAKKMTDEMKDKIHKTKEEKQEEKLGRLATDITNTDGVSCQLAGQTGQVFKRIQAHKSGPFDFQTLQFGQDLSNHHQGPIWCMKFSLCGRLMASAGQDCILRIWVLKDKYSYFHDMRRRYQMENEADPISSEQAQQEELIKDYLNDPEYSGHIFMDRPFVTYTGHTSDLLDVSWSKNYFILTSSMDKTVRLWHISKDECLCIFQHIEFVTATVFHPRNDQFFISGSLDGKIRVWNIPEKKVALWNEVSAGANKLITAASYCQNGKFIVVGTYDGRVIFFSTEQLKYHTTIHVQSSRSKNRRKITGIEAMPGEDRILITSNDSRIRLYDLRDLSLVCKYKGYTNVASPIKACFSPDGRYITSGSENQCVFLWSTNHVPQAITARKDRNDYYEAIKAHNAVVTCSLFAPVPQPLLEAASRSKEAAGCDKEIQGEVVVSGDFEGDIKIFINVRKN